METTEEAATVARLYLQTQECGKLTPDEFIEKYLELKKEFKRKIMWGGGTR